MEIRWGSRDELGDVFQTNPIRATRHSTTDGSNRRFTLVPSRVQLLGQYDSDSEYGDPIHAGTPLGLR